MLPGRRRWRPLAITAPLPRPPFITPPPAQPAQPPPRTAPLPTVAAGLQVQRAIEARAANGTPRCPNHCDLPYHPLLGHMGPGYKVTLDEELCLAQVAERGGSA